MRQKTYYAHIPEAYEISDCGEGKSVVFLRENIRLAEQDEYGHDRYEADEYTITVPTSAILCDRVSENFDRWLSLAKANDFAKAAKEVREKRNALLESTDKDMAFDRLKIVLPENITAITLLTGFIDFIKSIKEIKDGKIANYRQALRDIPEQPGFPYDVTFPEKPE